MNLILAFIILLLARKKQSFKFYGVLMLCFLAGMIYELIGVHTGYLFGQYKYGNVLGAKILEIPWVIGINWCSLVISSCSIAKIVKLKPIFQAIIAAALMLLLDILIEPVAVNLGFWIWETGEIPLYNYFCWFFLSIPLTFLYLKQRLDEQNSLAIALYIILVLFFGILNLLL